jgi:stage II sporulation protein D
VRSIRVFVALLAAAVCSCRAGNALAATPIFLVSGGGNGHGVGMSQYGAEGFALRGDTYRHILAHYYPGTGLTRVGNAPVRVLLRSGAGQVVIGSSGRFRVTDARGRSVVLPPGERAVGARFSVRVHRRPRLLRFPLRFVPRVAPLTLDGAAYRGSLTVEKGLGVVDTVPLESYLRGVVPAEMPSNWLRQALDAQAVAARSYALASLRRESRFDLYPDTRSQMYLGVRAERASTDVAVAETRGQVLTWHGQVAKTYFYSSSGGRTAANEDAWPGMQPVPYLRSVVDPYDTISPYHRWRPLVLSAGQLARRLGLPEVDDVEVTSAPSGWALGVQVWTPAGVRTFSASAFAHRLGLRSDSFHVGVLQLQASAGSTIYGHQVLLHGLTRGLRVTLQSRLPGGAWHSSAMAAADTDGRSSLLVRPIRTTEYRLTAEGLTTEPVRVDVAPALVVKRDRQALSGRVAPAIGGLRLAIQRLLAGNWLTIRSARVSSGGDFHLDRGLPTGTYRVRTAATALLLAGASSPIRVP